MDNQTADKGIPLVVDLDGTFLRTDILHEGILLLLKKNPLYIFFIFYWASKGKLYLKNKIAATTLLRYDVLPVNKDLLEFLKKESANGRKLVLATASLSIHANAIAAIYLIFNEVFGTEITNLKGPEKLKLLLAKYGHSQFDYIGDSNADLAVFSGCRYAYLVNPSSSLERKTSGISNLQQVFSNRQFNIMAYVKAIRAYQWIKNILIFIPVITSHSFYSLGLLGEVLAGFFAFSFAASAGYIINDLLDLEADRIHPRKMKRPFASGVLSIPAGFFAAFVLLVAAVFIAWQLKPMFLLVLLLYFITSFVYSFYFKKIVLYDVFILALLYSIRVIAGGLVTGIPISFWLIAFSTFIFLSLAFVKRYSELMKVVDDAGLKERGRGYGKEDLNLLQVMGIVSGFSSVVVFSLYIDSPDVSILYTSPKILWVTSLLFLFWISRIWVVTNRGKMTDDPIVFTIKDKSSYFIFSTMAFIIWLAM